MATPTEVQSVTVSLRSGVSEATLPNNVKMKANISYAISLEDFARISQGARDTVVAAPTFNTAAYIVPLWNAAGFVLDLTTINNFASIALLNADAQAAKDFAVGDVVRGFKDNAFKLVKVSSGSATVAAGSTVIWGSSSTATTAAAAKAASTVTSDFSDVTAQQFAGVAIGTITAGQYGWIQIAGTVNAAKVETNVAAGDSVSVSEATDETLTSAQNEVQTLTLTSFDAGDTIKLTHATVESAAVTASASAGVTLADFQAKADALFALTIPGYVAGACVVTQTTLNVAYVFTFSGASVRFTDQSAITATSGTGGSSGSFAETNKGNGAASGATVGTAVSSADTGTANIVLRSSLARNLRSRSRDIFQDARN